MNMSAPKKGIKRIKMATISVPDINFFEEYEMPTNQAIYFI